MEITQHAAQESLDEVRRITRETRTAIANTGIGEILMLWGVIWFVAFGATQFWPQQAGWVWLVGDTLGVIGTILLATGMVRPHPVRSPAMRRAGWRMFGFWCVLSAYSWFWLFILPPMTGLQVSAFITTIVMFAYVVLGLWFESPFLTALGLIVTVFVAAGYWLWPQYYCLWLSFAGGGALFGSGLYMRARWR
jgi:hypothetical protein